MAGYRQRARQWSGAALGLAALFASLGAWGLEGAWSMALLSALAGAYFYATGRRYRRVPDPASMLDRARELAAGGRTAKALALLTETIRLSPRFWQAFEYRAELYSAQGNTEAAARDREEAVRLGGPVVGLPQPPEGGAIQ